MYSTIEAIYKDGKIISTGDSLPAGTHKVLVTMLDQGPVAEENTIGRLLRYAGKIKNLPDNPVSYQRSLRDDE
jgi:putative lipase involved disintegration of autophagic bodies